MNKEARRSRQKIGAASADQYGPAHAVRGAKSIGRYFTDVSQAASRYRSDYRDSRSTAISSAWSASSFIPLSRLRSIRS